MATLGGVEIAVKIALETLGPQIAKLENELAKLQDIKLKATVLDSRDSVKNLKANLLEAQAIANKGLVGTQTKESAELEKQAALLREQVRFREELVKIKSFSPKEAEAARAVAKEINAINVAKINEGFTQAKRSLNDLGSRDALKELKASLLEAQSIGKRGFFGGATKESAELQRQAAILKEQVRFRQELVKIKGLSPKEADAARAVAKELNSINVKRINEDFKQATTLLGKLKTQADELKTSVAQGVGQGIGQSVANLGGGIVTAPFKAAGAVIGGLASTVAGAARDFITFEEQVQSAGVVSGSLGTAQFAKLRKEIQRLGIETSKSPDEIAATAVALSRAGFTAEETAGSLEAIARASEATGESLENVGDIVAKTYRTFETSFKTSGQTIEESSKFISNALVKTANVTNTSVYGIGESLKYVGSSAAGANQPVDDILVAIGLLGDAGIQGSQAGTNLRAALDRLKVASAASNSEFADLAKGSKKAVGALQAIGSTVRDETGQMRPLLDILPDIRTNLKLLSQEDKTVVLKALFGTEGLNAVETLLNVAPERVANVTEQIQVLGQAGRGAAVEAGEQQLQGLPGIVKLIGGSIDTLSVSLGQAFSPALEGALRFGNELIVSLLKNETIFAGITKQAEGFRQFLADNPEILAETQVVLGEVVTTLADQAAVAAQDFLLFLKENPEAISEAVTAMGDFIKVLGDAVKLATDLLGAVTKGVTELKTFTGRGGAAGKAAENVARAVPGVDRAALQENIERRRQAEVIEPQKQRRGGLTRAFGLTPIFGVAAFAKQTREGREKTAKIIEEETAKAIDAAAAASRKTEQAKIAPVEFAGPLLPGEKRLNIAKDQLADIKTQAEEATKAQADLNKQADAVQPPKPPKPVAADIGKQELAAIDKATAERDAAIKRSVLSGQLTTEQAEKARIAAETQLGASRIAALKKAQAQVTSFRQQGLLSEADAAKRSEEIQAELTKETTAQLDRQIEAQRKRREEQIKLFEDQIAKSEGAIASRQDQGSIAIKQQVLGGSITSEQAEKAQLEVEQRAGQERIALLQQQQARIAQLRQQGVLTQEEAAQRSQAVASNLAKEEIAQLDRQIEAQRKAREAQVKLFEEATKAEERAFQNTQRARTNTLKEGRLRGEAPEAIALKEVENQSRATLEEIDLVRDQLAGIESLRGRGALTAEDAANRQIDLQNKLGDLSTRILDNELAKREAIAGVIQRNGQLQQQIADLTVSQLEAQSKGLGQVSEALELNNQLLASRQGVLSASSDAAVTAAQSELSALQQADEIRKRLGEEGVGTAEKQVIGQRLGQLGLGAAASEADTLQARQTAEDKLAQAEVQRLLTQQNIERQNLDLQAQSNKIRAESLLLEKQIEQAKARQAIAQAQFNLEAAKAKGDPREVALAQAQVTLAEQQAGFAAQAVSLAQQNALVQAEVANNERAALGITQQAALQEQLRADQSREFLQAQERAKLVDGGATGLSTTIDRSAAQRQLQGALAQTGGAPTAAFTTPQIQAEQFRAANAGVEAKLDEVKAVLSQALAVPRSITVSTPQPVQDAAKILADASRLRLQ